jgi:hypothetical protein
MVWREREEDKQEMFYVLLRMLEVVSFFVPKMFFSRFGIVGGGEKKEIHFGRSSMTNEIVWGEINIITFQQIPELIFPLNDQQL